MPLLDVRNLSIDFSTPDGVVRAVRDLSFVVDVGETLGIVGESGSGKTQSMLGLVGLLADNGTATGSAHFGGVDLVASNEAELRSIRGRKVSMIFQDPMTSLNPYLKIETQMSDVLRAHEKVSRGAARARCLELLKAVQIPDAAARLDRYPHELSGGMRQRVMVATSLLFEPELLIADEPTTALDVTVQAQILELLRDLKTRFGTAIVLITHDLGVVAGLADRVLVMRDGSLVEEGHVEAVFARPQADYTRELIAAVPRLDVDRTSRLAKVGAPRPSAIDADGKPRDASPARGQQAFDFEAASDQRATSQQEPVLSVRSLSVHFRVPGSGLFAASRTVKAVDDVTLQLAQGETLGIVGESGCGKSTLARAILKLVSVTSGDICVLGSSLAARSGDELRALRKDMQVIFQDPLASLNPRMTVGDIVSEPLWTHRPELSAAEVNSEVVDVLNRVGLSGSELNRYPHEFSGGQCQRIGIARALVLKPRLIVCDEPVSALDVSIQAQIIDLLIDLREAFGISLIFIAHDLAVVRHLSHRVMVMYLGRAMEIATSEDLYRAPRHPYTRALIASVPIPDPVAERRRKREFLSGELPSPIDPPSGCRFRTRCRYAVGRCADEVPALQTFDRSQVACHRAGEAELTVGQR